VHVQAPLGDVEAVYVTGIHSSVLAVQSADECADDVRAVLRVLVVAQGRATRSRSDDVADDGEPPDDGRVRCAALGVDLVDSP
jgi:hypothetical protein